jgi:signal transduction histidine kinase
MSTMTSVSIAVPRGRAWPLGAVAVGAGAALVAGLHVASLPPALRDGIADAARHRDALLALGLSPFQYAAYVTGLVTVLAAVYLVVAVLLVRLPLTERPAATSSALVLVALAAVFPQTLPALARDEPGRELLLRALESFTVVALTAWILTFPASRTTSRPVRAAVLVVAAVEIAEVASLAPNPDGGVALALTIIWSVGLAVVAVRRYLRGTTDERRRSRWVLLSIAIALVALVLAAVTQSQGGGTGTLVDLAVQAGLVVAFLLIPLSLAAALARRGLWGLPAATGRAVSYGLLVVPVTAAYVCAVAAATALFPRHGTGAAALVAGLLALAVHPAYTAVRRVVDRALYGRPSDAVPALATLAVPPGDTGSGDVLEAAAAVVVRSLRVPHARVTVHLDGDGSATGAHGALPPSWPVLDLPLRHRGESVGELRVGLREGDGSLDPADHQAFLGLCAPLAVLGHSLQLNHRLARSRSEIVSAREEERRRLRDDLHDELGPALGAITLKLAAAERQLHDDPVVAGRLVHEAAAQTTAAAADVRRLIHGLRPPVLDDVGLVGAVQTYVATLHGTRPAVTVVCPEPLPPLPAATESAAYRIVLEALSNALRHADADQCRVVLELVGQTVRVLVVDDGRGADAAGTSSPGLGLISMRERAAEVGGRVDVSSPPDGGTTVTVLLPLPGAERG